MICQLCKTKIKNNNSLNMHLRYRHANMSIKTYYDKFMKKPSEGICKLNGCENETIFWGTHLGYARHCCKQHAQLNKETRMKIEQTSLLRHGGKTTFTSPILKERVKRTMIRKYGVSNPSFSAELNQKKSASLKRNKASCNQTYKQWLSQLRNTWAAKSHRKKLMICKQRMATVIKKYGSEQYLFVAGIAATCEKHGVKNMSQLDWVIKKVKKTWSNKSPQEIKFIRNKSSETCMQKYGVGHIMHDRSPKPTEIY